MGVSFFRNSIPATADAICCATANPLATGDVGSDLSVKHCGGE